MVGIALGGRGNPQPCFRDLSVSSSAPTPEIQVHSLPSRYERACDSPFFGAVCEVVCNYAIVVGKSDITSTVRKRRKRTRAIEDPAYDTITTTTAHLPDEIAQAVTSADPLYCLVTTNTTAATINHPVLCHTASKPKSPPRDSSLSSPVSAKRPEGRDSKAYRQSIPSI